MEQITNTEICSCGSEKAWDEPFCQECVQKKLSVNEPVIKDKKVQNKVKKIINNCQEIIEAGKQELGTPADMIRFAVTSGADLDKLEKLMVLQERWEANEAKKSYNQAMASFKANPPKIDKDKTVAYGNTKYNHASLGNVTEKINTELSKYGLSASWTTKQNDMIAVTCRITHIKGHSEETTLAAGSDSSGSKNSIQAIGSTVTYLERYTLLALTGLATYEQDDDTQELGTKYISVEQQHKLADLLLYAEAKAEPLFKYLGVESFEKIPESMYQKAVVAIEKRASEKVKK